MKMSGKHVPPGLSFAAGTLVGALAVLVPLTSAGHPGPNVKRSEQRSPGAVRSSAPAAAPSTVAAGSTSSTKQDSGKSDESSNAATCDVQLD